MKPPVIVTEDTRRVITDDLRKEFEVIWDKFTVDRGYGYFECNLLDLPGKPSFAKHIERLDDLDVFDSDIEAAFYGEKFFGEKLFHYDLGPEEELTNYWFVDEPQTREDVEAYLTRRFGENHGLKPDYETVLYQKDIALGAQVSISEVLKDAVALEYKGILFDEWTIDEDTGSIWGEICQCCADKYCDLLKDELDQSGGVGACSVKGCNVVGMDNDIEMFYVDLKPELINPLTKEQLQAYELALMTEKLFEDIKGQFDRSENKTCYGEPQAFALLENGRTIEVVLEQEGLPENEYFYSLILQCNEREYDNKDYNCTNGVIGTFVTECANIAELKDLIKSALKCNNSYPVAEHSQVDNERKTSLDDVIAECADKVTNDTITGGKDIIKVSRDELNIIKEQLLEALDGLEEYCETLEDSFVCSEHIEQAINLVEQLAERVIEIDSTSKTLTN